MYRDQWVEWAKPHNAELDRAYDFLSTDDLELARASYEAAEDCDDKHIGLAVISAIEGNFDAAIKYARKAIIIGERYREGNLTPALLTGDFFSARGQFEGAKIMYNHAVDVNLINLDALIRAGDVRVELGEYRDALDYFKLAEQACEEQDLELQRRIINTYLAVGESLHAFTVLKKVVQEDVVDPELWVRFGQCIMKLSRDNIQKAVEMYSIAIAYDPGCMEAYLERARLVWHNTGSPDALVAVMEDLERVQQGDATDDMKVLAYFTHGEILFHLSELETAKEKFEQALEIDLQYIDAWYGLADCAREQDPDQADEIEDIAERLLEPNDDDWLELEAKFRERREPERALHCSLKLIDFE